MNYGNVKQLFIILISGHNYSHYTYFFLNYLFNFFIS